MFFWNILLIVLYFIFKCIFISSIVFDAVVVVTEL